MQLAIQDMQVRNFVKKEKISQHLLVIISLISQHFSIKGSVVVTLENDPEDGEEYLIVEFPVSGSVDRVYSENEGFLEDALTQLNTSIMSKIRVLPRVI